MMRSNSNTEEGPHPELQRSQLLAEEVAVGGGRVARELVRQGDHLRILFFSSLMIHKTHSILVAAKEHHSSAGLWQRVESLRPGGVGDLKLSLFLVS